MSGTGFAEGRFRYLYSSSERSREKGPPLLERSTCIQNTERIMAWGDAIDPVAGGRGVDLLDAGWTRKIVSL